MLSLLHIKLKWPSPKDFPFLFTRWTLMEISGVALMPLGGVFSLVITL